MADAFNDVVQVIQSNGRELQLRIQETLSGVVQLFPLSAIKRDREGLFQVGVKTGGTLFYMTRDGIIDLHSSAEGNSAKIAALRDWLVARDGGPTHEVDSTIRPRPWEPARDAKDLDE